MKVFEAQEKQLELDTQRVAKFHGDKTILETHIENFGSLQENVSKLINKGNSLVDMRMEITRIEETIQRLIERKDDLITSSSGFTKFHLEGFKTKIRKEVVKEVEKAKAIALKYLKD